MYILTKTNALIFSVALFCFAMTFSTASHASSCQSSPAVLAFKPIVTKTKYNVSRSAFSLNALHNGRGGGLVTGLTLSPLQYNFESLFKVEQAARGVCVSLDKIKVNYVARPAVFVSREFPRGSCEFKAILRHENKHVSALKRVHAKNAKLFQAHVKRSLEQIRAIGPVTESQIAQAQTQMQDKLQKLLDSYMKQLNDQLLKQQNQIDSPAEYQAVAARCDGWADRLNRP